MAAARKAARRQLELDDNVEMIDRSRQKLPPVWDLG